MGWGYEALAILAAGFAAGGVNVIVGSGTLVSFPVLVLCGYPPVVANVSNTVGLVAGNLSGTIGYRRELGQLRPLIPAFLTASVVGGVVGAILLLSLPPAVFGAVVPVLIALGLVLVIAGPYVQRRAAARAGGATPSTELPMGRFIACVAGIFVLGIYGGYFGAAQGIIIIGLLGVLTIIGIQVLNALKNLLVMSVNVIAAVFFAIFAWDLIEWRAVALIAVGATVGGTLGARYGRHLPPSVLRAFIVVVGTAAIVTLVSVS